MSVILRALVVCAIWLTLALALDLQHTVVVAGVVTAFVLAWWDRQKALATHLVEEYDDEDEPFEEEPLYFV